MKVVGEKDMGAKEASGSWGVKGGAGRLVRVRQRWQRWRVKGVGREGQGPGSSAGELGEGVGDGRRAGREDDIAEKGDEDIAVV